MADPYTCDVTESNVTFNGYSTSTSSTVTCTNNFRVRTYTRTSIQSTGSPRSFGYSRSIRKKLEQLEELISSLKYWNTKYLESPAFNLRPSIQLRGVRLDGRGWA